VQIFFLYFPKKPKFFSHFFVVVLVAGMGVLLVVLLVRGLLGIQVSEFRRGVEHERHIPVLECLLVVVGGKNVPLSVT